MTRLLREYPELRHAVAAILAEALLPCRQELGEVLGELRALRGDFRRHVEETARRFEALRREMRGRQPDIPALSGHLGSGLEHIPRVEEFAGMNFTRAERLVLTDTAGEVYGVSGAQVECDLLVSDGTAYVVEVKLRLEPDDVLTFHRKAGLVARQLDYPVKELMIVTSMEERAEALLRQLGINFIIQSRVP